MAAAEGANDWEQCKENFAPVRQGRAKSVLSEVSDASGSTSKQALEAKRRSAHRAFAGDSWGGSRGHDS